MDLGNQLDAAVDLGQVEGGFSRRQDCHFDDALSPALLMHLLKGEGSAAE